MKKKYNVLALALAGSLILGACGNTETKEANQTETPVETEEQVTEEVTEPVETEEEVVIDEEETTETSDTENTEEEVASDDENSESNLVLHRMYPENSGERAFTNVVVATSGDKIVGAIIDEYQYFDEGDEYKAVPNSDGEFGEGTAEGKILGSKIENNEPYSESMKEAGGEITLLDNYNAVTDFATGKTIAELEEFLSSNEHEAIVDAVTGATFQSTPSLLQMIVDTAKDSEFASYGNAENPDSIELRYAIGAPHGDKSFGNAVVAVEGDTIVAASIDEFQYLEEATALPSSDKTFGEGYADSNVALGSKLVNNDMYSKLMADIAGSTVSIKDNFEAIENFVAGKTIEEIKEVIATANPEESVDSVTGATLVDTAGYLQLIVDAAENNIRTK